MNEHPGSPGQPGQLLRPVGYQTPQSLPPRKLPFNAKHMPVGVSANTINVASHIRMQRLRRLLFLGVPVAILLAVVCGVWLAARSLSPLAPKVITNDIFEYRFSFYKAAEPVNLDQGMGLQDGNRVLAIAKPTTDHAYTVCSEVGPAWRKAFVITLEGHEQPVCTVDNKLYLVIFSHDEKRHLFEINYTSTQTGKDAEISKIIASLKVSVP